MTNKIFWFGIIIAFGIVISGCASTSNSSNSDLFVVKESSRNDIKGTITDKTIRIYHKSPSLSEIWGMDISFVKRSSGDITANMINVIYLGDEWRFYDKIQIKIDDKLYELPVDNPTREVRSKGSVLELFNVLLPEAAINSLKTCLSIMVQIDGKYKGTPIQISSEGIPKINTFWQNN